MISGLGGAARRTVLGRKRQWRFLYDGKTKLEHVAVRVCSGGFHRGV